MTNFIKSFREVYCTKVNCILPPLIQLSTIFRTVIESPERDFLLVNNTNLYLTPFQTYCAVLLKFSFFYIGTTF